MYKCINVNLIYDKSIGCVLRILLLGWWFDGVSSKLERGYWSFLVRFIYYCLGGFGFFFFSFLGIIAFCFGFWICFYILSSSFGKNFKNFFDVMCFWIWGKYFKEFFIYLKLLVEFGFEFVGCFCVLKLKWFFRKLVIFKFICVFFRIIVIFFWFVEVKG